MGKTTGQPLLKNGSLYGEPKKVALSYDGSGSYVGTNAGTGEENVTEEVAQPPTFNHTPSDTVIAANKVLADQWNSMPGAYQSQWNSKINDYMSKIENRDPFSYNFNEDALYQMYRDQYIQQGQMAMMDTMGQAAAMTGGYGNSYAQSVGQQAYNQQLAQLNNIIPDLYQMAYNRYRDEGQDLLNMYNMYMDRENMDYGRYQDNLNNWWRETEYLAGRADTEYERDYNSQWDSYTAENDAYWKEYDANYNDPSGYYNGDLIEYQVEELQEFLGVTVDGKWGRESYKAAGGMTADEAWTAYKRGELKPPTDTPKDPQYTYSEAAQAFLNNLPYAHAGSSAETWKKVVEERLIAQYENGTLTEEDVEAIVYKLGL